MSIEDKVLFIRSCCVCRKIEYEGRIITEEHLRKEIGSVPYKLSHGFLSKQCANEFMEDVKHGTAYQNLAEKCE